ncbi:MAG: hypothetical protein ABIQ18_33340 [Umezawaea sp.]
MGKRVYGIHDTPTSPLSADVAAKAADFTRYEVIPHAGVEEFLVTEIPVEVVRRFADKTARPDYVREWGTLAEGADDDTVRDHVFKVLKGRKGAEGYAPLLVAECSSLAELPAPMANFLLQIDADLRPSPPVSATGTDVESDGS